jgi:hypothetical protein
MKLELTIQEINTIMQALGNAPYVQVADLVAKIREQAQPQVQAQSAISPIEEKTND